VHIFSLSGLTPVMAAMIDYVMKPFRKLDITTTEFAILQAIMFFDSGIILTLTWQMWDPRNF
jgi:hypothetical protein